jgi:prevent-host-death family protein
MTRVTASDARKRLYSLLDDVADSHEPVAITGKRNNAVLVSEADWRAIQETLYLSSIPKMRESIRKGLRTPVDKCHEDPGW